MEENKKDNSKWKLLLVEDNETNQMATICFLEQMGYEFDLAKNGAEALKLYTENPYHLVILDIGLPDINGIEVCKRMRNLKDTYTPIIALTAFGEFVEEDCRKAGVDDFVVKPFIFDQMNELIQELLIKE